MWRVGLAGSRVKARTRRSRSCGLSRLAASISSLTVSCEAMMFSRLQVYYKTRGYNAKGRGSV